MGVDVWKPEQYALFKDQRQEPFFNLLALLPEAKSFERIVDLGCGTGELTQVLHQRKGGRETCGIDRSPAMLDGAKAYAGSGLSFQQGLMEDWQDLDGVDLIFSNAALQWTSDHPRLFAHLLKSLKPGGTLAIQMPANHEHLSHRLAAEIAAEEPFHAALDGYVRISPVLPVEDYAALFYQLGLVDCVCLCKVYGHLLESSHAVVEWMKGTTLTDYEVRLAPDLYAQFLERYTGRLLGKLSAEKPYFFPFKRVLLRGTRKP